MKKLLTACCLIFCTALGAAAQDYTPDNELRGLLWEEFQRLPDKPKVGVALSAGGARGFAHVGVLETLTAAGFPIDCIAGTSMGSVVGSIYASGTPLSKLRQIGSKVSFSNVSNFGSIGVLNLIVHDKLLSSRKMEDFLNQIISDKTFEQTKIPFSCSAADVKTGEKIVFNSGPIAIAVRASMNIPGLFQPVQYRQRMLVDGGVVDYLPVRSARNMCAQWLLASITLGDYSSSSLDNILSYLMQVSDIRGAMLVDEAASEADFVIRPKLGDISFIEMNRTIEAADRGLEESYRKLNPAKESLILFSLKNVYGKYKKN